jgi:hypothetical protein
LLALASRVRNYLERRRGQSFLRGILSRGRQLVTYAIQVEAEGQRPWRLDVTTRDEGEAARLCELLRLAYEERGLVFCVVPRRLGVES